VSDLMCSICAAAPVNAGHFAQVGAVRIERSSRTDALIR
jgi:hypothetical protein